MVLSPEIIKLQRDRLVLAQFRRKFYADMAAFAFRLALLRASLTQKELQHRAGFNPAQARDPNGQWTAGGGSDHVHPKRPSDRSPAQNEKPREMIGSRRPFRGSNSGSKPTPPANRRIGNRDNGGPPLDPVPKVPPVAYPWDRPDVTQPGGEGRVVNIWDEENNGSHMIERHFGRSDEDMSERLSNMRGPTNAVGSFRDKYEADKFINAVLRDNIETVRKVVSGEMKGNVELQTEFNRLTGREAYRDSEFDPIRMRNTTAATVVIRADGPAPNRFRMVTGFPSTMQAKKGYDMKKIDSQNFDVPFDIAQFFGVLIADFYEYYDNGEDWLADQARSASVGRLESVRDFLDDLLHGGYSDEELVAILRHPALPYAPHPFDPRPSLQLMRDNIGKPEQLTQDMLRRRGAIRVKGPWQSWPVE